MNFGNIFERLARPGLPSGTIYQPAENNGRERVF